MRASQRNFPTFRLLPFVYLSPDENLEQKNGDEAEQSEKDVSAQDQELSEAGLAEEFLDAVHDGGGGEAEEEEEQERGWEVQVGRVRRNLEAQQDDRGD